MMALKELVKPLQCFVALGHDWGSVNDRKDYGAKNGTDVLRTGTQTCTHCGTLRDVFITPWYDGWRPLTSTRRDNIARNYKFEGRPSEGGGPGVCI